MPLWGNSTPAPQPPSFNAASQQSIQQSQDTAEADQAMKLALYELKGITGIFNKLTETCWEKCVANSKFQDGELTVGELACDDRCVIKYLAAMTQVSQTMAAYNNAAQTAQIPPQ